MVIKTVHLTNFRNFSQLEQEFALTTLFIGKNAQGKSNLLEALFFLATTKSPRVEKDYQLIKYGEAFARVEGEVGEELLDYSTGTTAKDKKSEVSSPQSESNFSTKLEVVMQIFPEQPERVEKRVKVNGVPRRVYDYIGTLAAVYFSPEDINLVSGSPSLRRGYLDLTLSQVDREYKRTLVDYVATLSSRNRLLKKISEGGAKLNELDFWTTQLVKFGQILSDRRRKFLEFINTQVSLSTSVGEFKYLYQESQISETRIKEYQAKEVAAATSLIGPHRDDFVFQLNGRDLAYFGSRGEQRTAVWELKLAELEFIRREKKTSPILLLDDVFSELDTTHKKYVVSLLGNQQTVITAVEDEQIPKELLDSAKIFRVEQGKVTG